MVDEPPKIKSLVWVGSSRRDLKAFPVEVKDVMGYALYQAQVGQKALSAKPLRGFGGAGVLEIVEDHRGDTYRATPQNSSDATRVVKNENHTQSHKDKASEHEG